MTAPAPLPERVDVSRAANAAARVVIVGAGFGGLAAARALGRTREPLQVTVIDRLNYHLFQPLLYQVALASLSATDIAYPIRASLHRYRKVEVLLGEVADFDLAQRAVVLTDGGTVPYDYLIVAAGARTSYFSHDDWAPFAPGLKGLDDALEIRRRVLLALEQAEHTNDPAERQRLMTFVVVGGGPTGVELAGAIADLSRDILRQDFRHVRPEDTRVVLVEMANRILTPFDPALSAKAAKQLAGLGVEIRTGVRVENIGPDGVVVQGDGIRAATVLWGAGVRPSPLAAKLAAAAATVRGSAAGATSGTADTALLGRRPNTGELSLLDRAGRVVVQQDCSVPGHPTVFAIGDLAVFVPEGATSPLPGISPVAIQQGRAVARNIVADLKGATRRPFTYFDKGFMATIGRARAVAQLRRLRLSGLVAWLAWVFVHLWYLVGFRNRVAVFLNWVSAYLTSRHGARVITGTSPPQR